MSILTDKVFIGLDNAPAAFDIRSRILGPNSTNLEYIRSETGVVAILKGGVGDKYEPIHLLLHHARAEALVAARSLALNLIETIRAELAQWSAAHAAVPPPVLSVPPPVLAPGTTPPAVPATTPPVTLASSQPATSHTTNNAPVASVAPTSAQLMTMRQPTMLQLLPQQQYVLNQDSGQLIPIVQQGVQVSGSPGNALSNYTTLPIAQSLGTLQPQNYGGTQIVDFSSMQPVNVTQLRLGGAPTSVSMLMQNGYALHQVSSAGVAETTSVTSATSAPVVSALTSNSTHSQQKVQWSSEKSSDKPELKYHLQGADTVQWTVPGSQTMLIPYQQLQELTSNPQGLTNIAPQQYVSIAPASGGGWHSSLSQASPLPLTATQLQQLHSGNSFNPNLLQLNQKQPSNSASLINIISTSPAQGQQVASNASTSKTTVVQSTGHEIRGQKRMSDGTPSSQIQLRPIAPAGSQITQDKGGAGRDSRLQTVWAAGAGRENVLNAGNQPSMTMRIISTQANMVQAATSLQTSMANAASGAQDNVMFARSVDKNVTHIQTNKDAQGKTDQLSTNKIQSNLQMFTVPPGMTVLQNTSQISQVQPVMGQSNNQVYMIHPNQANAIQNAGIPQTVFHPGQSNLAMMQYASQPGHIQNNMQYNTVPLMHLNMAQNSQYIPAGINMNSPMTAQQFNFALANQHMMNTNLQANLAATSPAQSSQTSIGGTSLAGAQIIPVSQSSAVQYNTGLLANSLQPQAQTHANQFVAQNPSYITPTTQYASMPSQYVMQQGSSPVPGVVPNNTTVQYSIQDSQANATQNNATGPTTPQTNPVVPPDDSQLPSSNTSNTSIQSTYVANQQTGYSLSSAAGVQSVNQQSAYASGSSPSQSANQQTAYQQPASNPQQTYASANTATPQNPNYSNPSVANQQSGTQQTGTYTGNTSSPQPPNNPNSYANGNNTTTQTATQQSNYPPVSTPAPQNSQQSFSNNGTANQQNTSAQSYQAATGPGSPAQYAGNHYQNQFNNRPWFRPRFGGPPSGPYNMSTPPPGPTPAAPVPAPPNAGSYNYWPDS